MSVVLESSWMDLAANKPWKQYKWALGLTDVTDTGRSVHSVLQIVRLHVSGCSDLVPMQECTSSEPV